MSDKNRVEPAEGENVKEASAKLRKQPKEDVDQKAQNRKKDTTFKASSSGVEKKVSKVKKLKK